MRLKRAKVKRKSRRGGAGAHFSGIQVRGFIHIQITDRKTGKIVGEVRKKNLVVNNGREYYIVRRMGGFTGGITISHLALATQTTATAAADNTLSGEQGGRKSLEDTSNSASNRREVVSPGTLRMTCSWDGTDLGGASPKTIGSIGAFNSSSGGTLACAAQYTTSQWTSQQNVNATYEIQFTAT